MNTRFNIQFLVTDYQDQETEGPGETVEETSGRVTGTGKQMTQVHDSYIIIIIISIMKMKMTSRVCQFQVQHSTAMPPRSFSCYVNCSKNLHSIAAYKMCYRLQELLRKQETLLNKANKLEFL